MILRCAATLLGAAGLARFAGPLIETGQFDAAALGLAAAGVGAAAWLGGSTERCAAGLEATVAERLIDAAERRLATMPARAATALPRGALIAGMQRHPGALARLVVGHAAARRMTGFGPLSTAAAVAWSRGRPRSRSFSRAR